MDTPKIAIAHDWLTSFGGAEQALLAAHELFPEAPIYTTLYRPAAVPQFSGTDVRTSWLQNIPTAPSRHQLFIPLAPAAFEAFDFKGYDAVLSFGTGFSKGLITQPDQPHINYCHSPARWLWHTGEDHRNQGRWDSGLRAWAEHRLRIWDVVSSERVDTFVANSKTTASRIAKTYRREAEVVYPPVDVSRFQLGAEKRQDFFLSVCRLVPYKRVDIVIEACLKAGKRLKVVGTGPEETHLRQLAGDSPLIEFLGFASDKEVERLYTEASAFLFAAEEDFGIVPVEAMAAGCPVIALGRGGVTESVINGRTGSFFMEQTADSLAEVLAGFQADRFDPHVLRRRAEDFGKDQFQDKLMKIVRHHL